MRLNNGQGSLRKNLSGDLEYESFVPAPLQAVAKLQLSPYVFELSNECLRQIEYLNDLFSYTANPGAISSLLIRKEALLSAQIEGCQCSFDDVFDHNTDDSIKGDVSEVLALEAAINYALERTKTLPLCMRLLREAHAILLDVPNGKGKTPGLMRTT